MCKRVLLVIDPQNDYLPDGAYPLWNTESTLSNIQQLMNWAQQELIPIILVQHISTSPQATFFRPGTFGVEICPEILQLDFHHQIVVKHYADSFDHTELSAVLTPLEVDSFILCGMMTQNCISFTALSESVRDLSVTVVADACTTVDVMIHNVALNGLSRRCEVISLQNCIGAS